MRSMTEFDRFLELYPDHPRAEEVRRARAEAQDRLARKDFENARLYYKMAQYGPALFYAREVQKSYPTSPWSARAMLLEAKALVKESKREEARSVLERLLASPPGGETEREARELLDDIRRQGPAAARDAPHDGPQADNP
jgi:outer membrane protein assembly factor BamD